MLPPGAVYGSMQANGGDASKERDVLVDRHEVTRYISERFSVEEEQPWGEGQGSVYRH